MTEEQRTGTQPYHLSYTYDQAGNRKAKTDVLNGRLTEYHYDVDSDLLDMNGDGYPENPRTYYGTLNNRLMYYEIKDTSDPGAPVLLETVYYEYRAEGGTAQGHPTFIVRKVPHEAPYGGEPFIYYGTALEYNQQGELWFVSQQMSQIYDDGSGSPEHTTALRVSEFKGSGRARYLSRQRPAGAPWNVLPETAVWSDYDGDEIYGDYAVDSGNVISIRAYLPGIGQIDYATDGSASVTYYHTDHLGTLRATSNDAGELTAPLVLTAFGEVVATDRSIGGDGLGSTRYQYAGDSGYESGLLASGSGVSGLPWQHVGARWYDPSTGRFLQRDLIGILGGLNVYVYCRNNPVVHVDPKGLLTPSDNYYFGHDWTKETDPWVNYPRQPDSGWTWRGRQEACTISLEALALVMGVTPGGQGFALALGGGLLAIHILEATGTIKPLSSTPENDIPAFIEYPGEGPVLYDCQCQACKLLRKNGGRVQKKFK